MVPQASIVDRDQRQDRTLVLRTLAAMLLAGILGGLLARWLTGEIIEVSSEIERLRDYIVPTAVLRRFDLLQTLRAARQGAAWLPWAAGAVAVALSLGLPLLFYPASARWAPARWRRLLSYLRQLVLLAGFSYGINALLEPLAHGSQPEVFLLAGGIAGVAFVLLGDRAFAGRLTRLRHWRSIARRDLAISFLYGAVWGGVAHSFYFLVTREQGFTDPGEVLEGLFAYGLLWSGGPESPHFIAALEVFERSSLLLLACGGAFAIGLLVALAPTRAPRLHRAFAVGLAALPLLVLVVYQLGAAQRHPPLGVVRPEVAMSCQTFECGVGLVKEDPLPPEYGGPAPPPPWQVSWPAPDGPQRFELSLRVEVPAFADSATTTASEHAVRKTEQWLSNPRWSRWTALASQLPTEIYLRLWKPRPALAAMLADVERTGSVYAAMRAAMLAAVMPHSAEVQRTASQLLNEKRFQAGDKGSLQLSRLAARMGQAARAKAVLVRAGYPPTPWIGDGWSEGELRACFVSEHRPLISRVGLFRVVRPLVLNNKGSPGLVVASQPLDSKGCVQFSGLVRGEYLLGVRLDPAHQKEPPLQGGALGPVYLDRDRPSARLGTGERPAPTAPAAVRQRDQVEVVGFPAGRFYRGLAQKAGPATPRRAVQLEAFALDRYEVSVAQYRACERSGACRPAAPRTGDGHLAHCNVDEKGRDDHPINCVTLRDAWDYCLWVGKRLPSEAEWERAARGLDERPYPWGSAPPTCQRANFYPDQRQTVFDELPLPTEGFCTEGTLPVTAHDPGPERPAQLAGNVAEWVGDWYAEDYYRSGPDSSPRGPAAGTLAIVRGGSWLDEAPRLHGAHRQRIEPEHRRSSIGFRCASDLPAAPATSVAR